MAATAACRPNRTFFSAANFSEFESFNAICTAAPHQIVEYAVEMPLLRVESSNFLILVWHCLRF